MGCTLLRRLPLLLAVVSGDLRLFGTSPLTRYDALNGGDVARHRRRAGLFGPTQIILGLDAPLESRLASDAQAGSEFSFVDLSRLAFEFLRRLVTGGYSVDRE